MNSIISLWMFCQLWQFRWKPFRMQFGQIRQSGYMKLKNCSLSLWNCVFTNLFCMSPHRFLFLNQEIVLKPSVGILIAMNPGYAGRAELPENIKALFRLEWLSSILFYNIIILFYIKTHSVHFVFCFRPCAMVVPDTELICEIMLVTEGFCGAKPLAKKFTTLYNLCKELLSKQVGNSPLCCHYILKWIKGSLTSE